MLREAPVSQEFWGHSKPRRVQTGGGGNDEQATPMILDHQS